MSSEEPVQPVPEVAVDVELQAVGDPKQERDDSRLLANQKASGSMPNVREREPSVLEVVHRPEDFASMATWPEERLKRFVENIPVDSDLLREVVVGARTAGWLEPSASLSFRNLYYRKQGQMLVNGVSGYLTPGMMVAVMGQGATQLFEVLTNRQKGGRVSGEVLINNKLPDETLNRLVGYVTKEDIFLPTLTVAETLTFSNRLRSVPSPAVAKMLSVQIVMKLLGLDHVADTIVGDQNVRGISGGEKRRLSLGVEIVAGHSIVMADLPTNGLDSASALTVAKNARRAADAGSGVIHSLVQPAPELLALYDCVLLLSRGSTIYWGPPAEAERYLRMRGFVRPHAKSVPDFLEELCKTPQKFFWGDNMPKELAFSDMDMEEYVKVLEKRNSALIEAADNEPEVSSEVKSGDELTVPSAAREENVSHLTREHSEINPMKSPTAKEIAGRAHKSLTAPHKDAWLHLIESYKNSTYHEKLGAKLWKDLQPSYDISVKDEPKPQYHTDLWTQIKMCVERQFLLTLRDPAVAIGGIFRAIFVGLILGAVFFQLAHDQEAAYSRIGMLFYIMTFASMSSIQTIPTLVEQRVVFYEQQAAGYFRGFAFYVANVLALIPFALVEMFLFSIIVYSMSGLNSGPGSTHYWYMYLILVFAALTSKVFAIMCTALAPSDIVALAVTPVLLVLMMLFCGYMAPVDTIPQGWIWMYYLSFMTPCIRGLALNEYGDKTFMCGPDELVLGQCPVTSGQQFLAQYGMEDSDPDGTKWVLFRDLIFFFIAFNVGAAYSMVFVSWAGDATVEVLDKDHKHDEAKKGYEFPEYQDEDEIKASVNHRVKPKNTAVTVSFNDLNYDVDIKDEDGNPAKKRLLTNVFGYAPPGKMVALMGASGAGKSTLLDVLAGRKTGGYISGEMLFNGHERDEFFNRIAGYVEQTDSHEETSTVREAIQFSADLRLPRTMPQEEKDRRVNEVMQQLELEHVADDIIGSVEHGGISPELRKKVTIAVELVMDPGVLFLDEPTTGLNSAAALDVMIAVRRLANFIPVICTIHQPSQEVVEKFDWLLLLQKGGTVVYFGEVDKVPAYMDRVGLGTHTPGRNLADFALEAIANSAVKAKEDAKFDAANIFLESAEGKAVKDELEQGVFDPTQTIPTFEDTMAAPFIDQFYHLTCRFFYAALRDQAALGVRIFQSVAVAFIIGSMYFQLGRSQIESQSRISLCFLVVIFQLFGAQSVIPQVIKRRGLYFRESTSSMYNPSAYFWARTVADVPFLVVVSFLFGTILYWLAGLRDDDAGLHYGGFLAALFVMNSMAYAFNELVATISPNAELANVLGIVVITVQMLFCGFLIRKEGMADGWLWMYYVNMFRYPLFYFAKNELEGLGFNCNDGTGAILLPSAAPSCVGDYSNTACYVCPITNGDSILASFSIDASLGRYFGILVGMAAFFRLAGYFALKHVSFIKR